MDSFFDDILADASSLSREVFGRQITTYTDASGATVTELEIELGAMSAGLEQLDDSLVVVRRRQFTVFPREIQDADSVRLDLNGKFTIDDMTWSIESIEHQTAAEIHGTLKNVRTSRKTPKGYQRGIR